MPDASIRPVYYEAICPLADDRPTDRYLLQFADKRGNRASYARPVHSFPTLFSEYDLFLLNEGTHWKSYEKLSAPIDHGSTASTA